MKSSNKNKEINTLNDKYTSLGALAQELGFNKSKLIYYASLGFLKPVDAMIGKTMIFEKQRIIRIINLIIKYQKDGKSLDEIKFLIK